MDGSAKVIRKSNPRDSANIFSKITFLFSCGTFKKGFRDQFEERDIYDTSKNFSSTKLSSRLEKEWEKEKKKKRNPGITVPLIKLFGIKYIVWGVTYFSLNTIFVMSKPLLKGKIISYFAKNETTLSEKQAYYYTGGLGLCIIGSTLLYHSYAFGIEQVILKIRIAICGLVYRKALKLDSHFMSKDTSGQAITLITKDIEMFDSALIMLHKLWVGTIQMIIMIYIMYVQIGVAALVGALAIFLPIPVLSCLGKKVSEKRESSATYTDERVRKTQELLTSIKTIKMYTWETFFERAIARLRKKEIVNLRTLLYIKALILSVGLLSAKFGLYFCIITYVALGNHITAEKAFVVTGCFSSLDAVISIYIPWSISQLSDLKASLQRISKYLLLDEIDEKTRSNIVCQKGRSILIKNAEVKLENIPILNNINLEIRTGVTVLTGTIGAGKSTLLKLILGDIKRTRGVVEISGNVSYASQEPWLFPGSIKQNIVFNEIFDENRYRDVIQICALRKDLDNLPNGDQTYLTDKGLNLSRGQKCRINLARAVYKVANIYLLDDCLSAVDGHVGKHIFYECKKFFTHNICLLVTHQQLFLRESDCIIILNEGSIKFTGTYENLVNLESKEFEQLLKVEGNVIDFIKTEEETPKNEVVKTQVNQKKIYDEVTQVGKVSGKVYFTYFKSGGGTLICIFVMLFAAATQGVISWNDYFVSFWVDMEQEISSYRFNQTTHLDEFKQLEKSYKNVMILYSVVIVGVVILTLSRAFSFFYFTSKASTKIHNLILKNVVDADMTFFNENLSGNVLNRLSRDLTIIDEQIPRTLFQVMKVTFTIISTVIVISTVNPMFLIPSAVFLVVLYLFRYLYLPTARSIRRLEGATRSPVVGHFNSTLDGLTTIRANSAQEIVKKEFDSHQDLHNSARYMHVATMESFSFYLDVLSDSYILIIIISFLIFKSDTSVGRIGLAITQAFILTRYLHWGIRQWAELENHMTSSERVLEYKEIEQEVKTGEKINNWPTKGKINFKDVSLKYNATGEKVLNGVNFVIESKQKIGVVGRTGAGKSTIVSALFRLYKFEGTITIDSIDTKEIETNFLRKHLSIIPQDPVLFTGTIRNNLDPYGECSDETLWKAIEEVDLKNVIKSLGDNISETGSNFSVGQRQLICLARALIRNNNILILDEATASMDPHTDSLIQSIIRKRFSHCTIIIIAHRLNTILDTDKILVVDFGKILQYDAPQVLLQDENGTFYKMVKNAGLI
ncbi:hypothetical protein FQR65_LT10899 [Abscondita terminalis]|nr:hypothetical protein FQR65_LT10899 [Abscondita terminalis]